MIVLIVVTIAIVTVTMIAIFFVSSATVMIAVVT